MNPSRRRCVAADVTGEKDNNADPAGYQTLPPLAGAS